MARLAWRARWRGRFPLPVSVIYRLRIDVRLTGTSRQWLYDLRDRQARARIVARLDRLAGGHFGDVKRFDGIGEMRIDYGPGSRLYFVQRGATLTVLLCGGDKGSQRRDIERAKALAKEI